MKFHRHKKQTQKQIKIPMEYNQKNKIENLKVKLLQIKINKPQFNFKKLIIYL